MKKFIILLVVLAVLASAVIADQERNQAGQDAGDIAAAETADAGSNNKPAEIESVEIEQNASKGEKSPEELVISPSPTAVQNKTWDREIIKARIAEIRAETKKKKQEMKEDIKEIKAERKAVLEKQNEVRTAVHALLAMENLTGGIGPQVREVARDFNNSAKATEKAEEKIQKRSKLKNWLIGGDENAAADIEEKTNQMQEKIAKLNELIEQCDCDEEVKIMMKEQIQGMQQEQQRLKEVAKAEKQRRGIFSWLLRKK